MMEKRKFIFVNISLNTKKNVNNDKIIQMKFFCIVFTSDCGYRLIFAKYFFNFIVDYKMWGFYKFYQIHVALQFLSYLATNKRFLIKIKAEVNNKHNIYRFF